MSIQLLLSQALRGKITLFLLKYFKGGVLSDDWNERIQSINNVIAGADNVLELKLSVQDYLKNIAKSLWMIVPGSALRVFYKSLEEVINDDEFSDRNLLNALAQEEKVAVNEKVFKMRNEFKSAVRKVNRECRSLKKSVSEQQDEVKRLTMENQLLLAALLKMNQHASSDNVLMSKEIVELREQNTGLLEQNQRLLKIISSLIKRPLEEVETILQNIDTQDDPVEAIVKKLQKMSSKNPGSYSRAFFKPSQEEGGQPGCSL